MTELCVGVFRDHPQVRYFTSRTHRTQHVVILVANIYFNEKLQSRISKGKMFMRQRLDKTTLASKNPLPLVIQDAFK